MNTDPVLPLVVRTAGRDVVSLLPYDTPMWAIRTGLSAVASGPWEIHAVELWDEEGEW